LGTNKKIKIKKNLLLLWRVTLVDKRESTVVKLCAALLCTSCPSVIPAVCEALAQQISPELSEYFYIAGIIFFIKKLLNEEVVDNFLLVFLCSFICSYVQGQNIYKKQYLTKLIITF